MLISHKHKFICISIPKTGTRSIRETMQNHCHLDICALGPWNNNKYFIRHGTILDAQKGLENIGSNVNDYFSFCFVRNPWERYLSFFKYYKEKAEEYLKTTDFKEWKDFEIKQGKNCVNLFSNNNEQHIIRQIIKNNPAQSCYFLNENQEMMVSHVARFENLQKEFDYLCGTIGLGTIKLSHGNKSITQISCSDIYDQELIDLVAEKEKEIIDLMSYTYE